MGVFFDKGTSNSAAVEQAVAEALKADPPADETALRVATRDLTESLGTAVSSLATQRLIGAIVLVMFFVVGGVALDVTDHGDSSKTLFGFASTLFGVIVGLLGGEK